jgi:hypothetical protein
MRAPISLRCRSVSRALLQILEVHQVLARP